MVALFILSRQPEESSGHADSLPRFPVEGCSAEQTCGAVHGVLGIWGVGEEPRQGGSHVYVCYGFKEVVDEEVIPQDQTMFGIIGSRRRGGKNASHVGSRSFFREKCSTNAPYNSRHILFLDILRSGRRAGKDGGHDGPRTAFWQSCSTNAPCGRILPF